MFYSHQLLARKAPLGQIWMAATMHAKINRRKLDKLNIITICEEILNPSVPMALRLSGILMGGVVIVYERKVKLLYDDVTRLVVEMNEAWKVKAAQDSTVLPKGKSQAKKEAVTLPDREETDVGEIEQSLNFSNKGTTMGFQQTAYFAMRLDSVDEPYINENPRDEDPPPDFHQADAANITLFERFSMYRANVDPFNRFERFDIEGDEEMVPNFTSGGDTEIPTTLIPSPPPQDEPQRDEIHDQHLPAADEIHDQHPEDRANQQSEHHKEASQQDQQRKGPIKRKARKPAAPAMDYEQTIIPGHVYQSWLQNPSDICSRKGRKRKRSSIMSAMKIADLMELPPVALIDGALLSIGNREIHYPAPLLELWIRSTQPPHDSPSGRTSPPLPPEPSSLSPPYRVHYEDPIGFPFEDVHSGVGSQSMGVPMERQRDYNNDLPTEIVMAGLRTNLLINGIQGIEPSLLVTPRNSGDRIRSIHGSAPEAGLPEHNLEVNSGCSNKKRPYSSSIHSGSSLEPVDENKPWQDPDPNFNLARLSENGLTPDQELLVETGPTQTQKPIVNHPIDQLTDSIRMQMKTHFDTPGVSQVESLNHLAAGMMRKGAAMLFYQTCVLASREFLRVEQKVPYGDILIFKGAKM